MKSQLIDIMDALGMYLALSGAPAEARTMVLEGLVLAYKLGVKEGPEGLATLRAHALTLRKPVSPNAQ